MFPLLLLIGYKVQQPPLLPANYVRRQKLFKEMATILCHAINNIDSNTNKTTMTVTGVGGFGKTTTVIAVCRQHHIVREQYTDGFLFVELGPQATDPSIKLRGIYSLLTNEQCDINVAEEKVRQVASAYYHNLLVIIDDVWHVEDAEPIVRAFSSCVTVLTTRMSDIEMYLPTKHNIIIGPMENSEAITLLTSEITNNCQLSQEDRDLLNELAQDVHLWPLLLCLIRAQICYNIKQHHISYHNAIKSVQTRLQDNGLTAFDKNDIENINRNRKYAAKVCIDATLKLIKKPLSDSIKSLILYAGIGVAVPAVVLNKLWHVSQGRAGEIIDTLWAYSLVNFTDTVIPPNNSTQHCVEVHTVISQYIIESMDSQEIPSLPPFSDLDTITVVDEEVTLSFLKHYGVSNTSSLSTRDYLKFRLSQIENSILPNFLKIVNVLTIAEPHVMILMLQLIQDAVMTSPCNLMLLQFTEKLKSLIPECQKILHSAHSLTRKFSQKAHKILCEKEYEKLVKVLEDYMKNYPICNVAQNAVAIVEKIIPQCTGKVQEIVKSNYERLHMNRFDYHQIRTQTIPRIDLFIKLQKHISKSLLTGSPDIESTYHYITIGGSFNDEYELTYTNYLIKLQEVAPDFVYNEMLQQ